MKRVHYVVRINKDADSDWGASVLDLPGCVATAKTVETVLRRIRVAIEIHLEGMRQDGLIPPRPRARVVVPRKSAQHTDFYASVDVAA